MNQTVTWLNYAFGVYLKNTNWSTASGIYIFCGLNPQGMWRPYYIGQADQFISRLPNHERWDEAVRLGATHVHAMAVSLAAMRQNVEQQLIAAYQPTLNSHYRGIPGLFR
jgi:hypothetical protein